MEQNTFSAAWIATLPAAVQTLLNGRAGLGDVYAYDWAYRLVDARFDVTNPLLEVATPGSQPFVKRVGYTLDGLGNRSQVQTWPPTPPTNVTHASDVVNQYTILTRSTAAALYCPSVIPSPVGAGTWSVIRRPEGVGETGVSASVGARPPGGPLEQPRGPGICGRIRSLRSEPVPRSRRESN